MNKKLLTYSAASVIGLIILTLVLLRMTPLGLLEGPSALVVQLFALLLALPLRLHVILFMDGINDSWTPLVLACMILLSGLFWGVTIERTVYLVRKTRGTSS